MTVLLSLSLAMAMGLVFNRIAKHIGLPFVTGYLIAGVLIGPFVLNWYPETLIANSGIITNVALGFIAFAIGGEFRWKDISHIGKKVLIVTLLQALAATFLVDAALLLFQFPAPVAITLGAIATATAPAATLMVVKQYSARGPVTDMLLPVVALDDAVGLMVFSVSISIARALAGSGEISFQTVALEPLLEIFGSLAVGALLGLAMTFCLRFFASRANRLCLILCAVFAGTAVAEIAHLSSLLLCMSIGVVLANCHIEHQRVMDVEEHWTAPLFMLFFVISGAELDLGALPAVGLLGLVYLVMRSAGKIGGAWLGATVTKSHKNIRKFLGITLLPQAGVALGMAQLAVVNLPAESGNQIRTVVLAATLIYELVGPLLTKMALTKAGEIVKPSKGAVPQAVPAAPVTEGETAETPVVEASDSVPESTES